MFDLLRGPVVLFGLPLQTCPLHPTGCSKWTQDCSTRKSGAPLWWVPRMAHVETQLAKGVAAFHFHDPMAPYISMHDTVIDTMTERAIMYFLSIPAINSIELDTWKQKLKIHQRVLNVFDESLSGHSMQRGFSVPYRSFSSSPWLHAQMAAGPSNL